MLLKKLKGRNPIYRIHPPAPYPHHGRDPIYRVPPLAPFMGEGSHHGIRMEWFNCIIAPARSPHARPGFK